MRVKDWILLHVVHSITLPVHTSIFQVFVHCFVGWFHHNWIPCFLIYACPFNVAVWLSFNTRGSLCLQNFQHQLGAKHPVYYSTMRLGRALKDRCVKSDPEREIMNQMLEDLKNKWSVIRSIVSQRWVARTIFLLRSISSFHMVLLLLSHVNTSQIYEFLAN